MIITRVKLKNWRNFKDVDVRLHPRTFLAGANASGKSNFLDVFRFLSDIARQNGGGLQQAVKNRGGLGKIRCLAARSDPAVQICVEFESDRQPGTPIFIYDLQIKHEGKGLHRTLVGHENVWQNGEQIVTRPDDDDKKDTERLTETVLEQVSRNEPFREVARFFEKVCYRHLVPQLVRNPQEFAGSTVSDDPFGRDFLRRIARTPKNTREARFRKIDKALRQAVPYLKSLSYLIDEAEGGIPHLQAIYQHWRIYGARQRESEFSDGTLRLIGLFWTLLESDSLLLLEEPELSLNGEIVKRLPSLFHQLVSGAKKERQVLVSTHSWELLSDKGIGGEEVLLLKPGANGTEVEASDKNRVIRHLLESGMSAAEAVLPHAAPEPMEQLVLFS